MTPITREYTNRQPRRFGTHALEHLRAQGSTDAMAISKAPWQLDLKLNFVLPRGRVLCGVGMRLCYNSSRRPRTVIGPTWVEFRKI